MKISIVTVLFNAQNTISDTIASVRSQQYSDYEHILVDGNSTDDSLEIAKHSKHEKMILVSEADDGIYDAMNKGARLATGELIGFLNADDYFCRTDALKIISDAALSNPGSSAISASVAIVDAFLPDRIHRYYGATPFARWMLRFGHMPPHPGFYVRRAAFAEVGPFSCDFKIAGDFEWMLRFFYANRMTAARLPDALVAMRTGGVSTRGLRSMRLINAEALKSLAANQIASSSPLLWSRYVAKVAQFAIASRHFPPPQEVRWMPALSRLL